MASLHYQALIQEEVSELLLIEKEQRQARIRNRLRFIRLLKEGPAAACPELNPVGRFFEELRKWTANHVFAEADRATA